MVNPPDASLGIICTPKEWEESELSRNGTDTHPNQNHPTLHCLTRGQSMGLTVTTEAAFLSVIAIFILFAMIGRNVVRRIRAPGKWSLVKEPADIYMLSLFVADFIQAIGYILDIKWINQGKVEVGPYCTAQGVIQQLGETPVAMNTLAIAIHTFVTVWWKKGVHARSTSIAVVGCIWAYVIMFVIIGTATHKNYMTPTPYWCWIGPGHMGLRIAGEYVWLWTALFVSFGVYVPLALWSRGNISMTDKWWKIRFHRRKSFLSNSPEAAVTKNDHERTRMRVALGMLAYPIIYSLVVLPLSVVRWITFASGTPVDSAWTFFTITVYSLSGCFNVILVLATRPQLLLFGTPSSSNRHSNPPISPTFAFPRARGGVLPNDSESVMAPPRWRVPGRPSFGDDDEELYELGKAKLRPEIRITPVERPALHRPDTRESSVYGGEPRHDAHGEHYPLTTRTEPPRLPSLSLDEVAGDKRPG